MVKRVIRKKVTRGPDELITASSRVLSYLSNNFKVVVIASSVIGALFLSYSGWFIYSDQKNRRAAEAFYSAMKIYQAKVEPSGTAPDRLKTLDEKERAVIKTFTDLSKSYKGSKFETIALLYAANSYYNLKEFDKAIELYDRILFKTEREDSKLHGNINEVKESPGIVRDATIDGLAYSYQQKGDLKKAIEFQSMLTSSKDSHLRETGLAALGRLYEKSNDKAKAIEMYKKIISEFPESPTLSDVKERMEGLKG